MALGKRKLLRWKKSKGGRDLLSQKKKKKKKVVKRYIESFIGRKNQLILRD